MFISVTYKLIRDKKALRIKAIESSLDRQSKINFRDYDWLVVVVATTGQYVLDVGQGDKILNMYCSSRTSTARRDKKMDKPLPKPLWRDDNYVTYLLLEFTHCNIGR